MRKQDVPQDQGIAEGLKEVNYAIDEDGNYVLVPSAGWEPKNIANYQAWDLIKAQLADIRNRILAGELSPLAFHMARNQMDVKLLSKYSGFFCWQIKRHLKPSVFAKLKRSILKKYAALFGISLDDLTNPDSIYQDNLPGSDWDNNGN